VEACWVSEVQDGNRKELGLLKEEEELDFDRGKAFVEVGEEQSGYEDYTILVAEDEEEVRCLVEDRDHSVGEESDSVEGEYSKHPIEVQELAQKLIGEGVRLSDPAAVDVVGSSEEVVLVVVELDFSGELERFEVPPISFPNVRSHSSTPFHLKLSLPH